MDGVGVGYGVGSLWPCVGTFVDVFTREEEQGKETGESEVYPLCLWMVKSRLGWAGKQKLFAHLRKFLLSCLYKQVLYFRVSYFGFLLCRVGMSFLQRAENGREGREVWH